MVYRYDPMQSPVPERRSPELQGNYPAPGGPDVKPTPVKEALMKELTQAGITAQKTGSKLGVGADMERDIIPERGIKMGGKIVAKAELDESMFAQKNAINDYIQQAGYTNMADISVAKSYMNDRLNTARTKLLKMAAKFNKKLMEEKVSEEKRRAAAKNWGAMAGAIAGGIIGSYVAPGVGTYVGAGMGAEAGENLSTVLS